MTRHTTRRRLLQATGLVGITTVTGTTLVAAQETPTEGTPTDGDGAAVRVAHASPAASPVDVSLDGETVVESLAFGEVTDYAEVQPGSYQLQVVAAEQGQTTLYDEQVEVPEGASVTAVAFGQVTQGEATPTDGTGTPSEGTPANGTATEETPADGTATPTGETPTDGTATEGTPADGTATPGAGTAEVVTEIAEGALQGDGPEQGEGQGLGAVVEGLAYGEAESFTAPAGDYRLLVRPTDEEETTPDGGTATATRTGTPTEDGTTADEARPFEVALLVDDLSSPPEGQARTRVFHAVPDLDDVTIVATPSTQGGGQGQGQGGGQGQGPPNSFDVTLEGDTVYAGFAVGYADPETEATPEDGTPTDGERPELDLVVAETAVDGERAAGGTNGN